MAWQAPLADIAFSLRHVANIEGLCRDGLYPEASADLVDAVLEEAGRFASERIAPLNRDGDRIGARFENGRVTTAPGWRETYKDWSAAGWSALTGPVAHGGQGLPLLLNAACLELWNGAAMAFGLCPVLTMGAVEALVAHGSDDLKARYLDKLVSGEWTGTMNLTEPQAGSDLAALRAKAERHPDGSYRIIGQKIFITYGEQDLTDNIIHLVLARLPDAPAGTRGITLFLVPKFLPDASGRPVVANDLKCAGIEHKLGLHGSPTCTMVFGDHGGATAYLVGEENRGLACMFTMMNNARLAVGLQGVAVAGRAYEQALAFARERRQGRAPGWTGEGMSPIIGHADVRRMLLEMRAKTVVARGLCYQLAEAIDRSHHSADEAARREARDLAALLTPVAKAYATDIANEVASLGVQVHGGMGFIEETGAAQHMRDARITAIYEGTNGIQAIDLVTRKLALDEGRCIARFVAGLRATLAALARSPNAGLAPPLEAAVEALERATAWLVEANAAGPDEAQACAVPYLRLFATAAGGVVLAREVLASGAEPEARLRLDTARFYATQIAPQASGLAAAVTAGAEAAGLAGSFDRP